MFSDQMRRFAAFAGLTCFPLLSLAQDRTEPPVLAVGDRWQWTAKVNPRDSCTDFIPAGAKVSETVTEVSESGYRVDVTGPGAQTRFFRTYAKDMSFSVRVKGELIRSNPINFPLVPGNKWETTLGGGNVVTTLACEQETPTKMKVADEDLAVIPITCKGRWLNTTSNNSDIATYKYWYSPVVGAAVKRTVFTYFRGNICADQEYLLESYGRAK